MIAVEDVDVDEVVETAVEDEEMVVAVAVQAVVGRFPPVVGAVVLLKVVGGVLTGADTGEVVIVVVIAVEEIGAAAAVIVADEEVEAHPPRSTRELHAHLSQSAHLITGHI